MGQPGEVPDCITITIFRDYTRTAIRLAALAQAGMPLILARASLAAGRGGPAHQPVEAVPSLRMVPDLTARRLADDVRLCAEAADLTGRNVQLVSMPWTCNDQGGTCSLGTLLPEEEEEEPSRSVSTLPKEE